jgi:uncharacterized protein (DUF433 family)
MGGRAQNNSPFEVGDDGELRIAGTPVAFSLVLHALNRGHTAQEIVDQFPELTLGDVQAVLTHYLRRGSALD